MNSTATVSLSAAALSAARMGDVCLTMWRVYIILIPIASACRASIDGCLPCMYHPAMVDKPLFADHAAQGGKARAAVLSPEERRAIARTAALARWGDKRA